MKLFNLCFLRTKKKSVGVAENSKHTYWLTTFLTYNKDKSPHFTKWLSRANGERYNFIEAAKGFEDRFSSVPIFINVVQVSRNQYDEWFYMTTKSSGEQDKKEG